MEQAQNSETNSFSIFDSSVSKYQQQQQQQQQQRQQRETQQQPSTKNEAVEIEMETKSNASSTDQEKKGGQKKEDRDVEHQQKLSQKIINEATDQFQAQRHKKCLIIFLPREIFQLIFSYLDPDDFTTANAIYSVR